VKMSAGANLHKFVEWVGVRSVCPKLREMTLATSISGRKASLSVSFRMSLPCLSNDSWNGHVWDRGKGGLGLGWRVRWEALRLLIDAVAAVD